MTIDISKRSFEQGIGNTLVNRKEMEHLVMKARSILYLRR